MTKDADRQTGRTTQQIKDAPRGAIFICPPQAVPYTRSLAHHLGRPDLRIERPDFFTGHRWAGLRLPVVVDHAAPRFFGRVHWDGYDQCSAYLRAHNIAFN